MADVVLFHHAQGLTEGVRAFADRLQAGMLPDLSLPLVGWASLAGLPLAAGLVAGLTARITVMRNLRRMI